MAVGVAPPPLSVSRSSPRAASSRRSAVATAVVSARPLPAARKDQARQLTEDRIEFGKGIGTKGIAHPFGRGLLRLGPPACKGVWA